MTWAVENVLITGTGAGALNPQGTATRAEVAAILARFVENVRF
ncbi:S-layer homology domain-containing protein [Pseudoflavonifractor capillosus]